MEFPYIKVLSFELEFLDEIDAFTSLDFRRSLQGTGDFTFTVCGFPDSLRKNNIIMLGEDTHRAGIIRKITPVSDKHGIITEVSGQTLNGFTSQRTVLPLDNNAGYFSVPPQSEHISVHAEKIIKSFLSYNLGADAALNRQLFSSDGRLIFRTAPDRQRGYPTEWGCRYTQLDDELQAICEYCDCGYEIYIDLENKLYTAEYIPGTDRSVNNNAGNSWVILSKEFESVDSIEYTEDYTAYKNIAYCGGKGDGDDRAVISVTNDTEQASGIDRFETFIDCGDLEIMETTTAMSLSETGKHKLEEYNFVKNLNAVVSQSGSFRYREQWDLGDLVTICDDDLKLMQDVRITEVLESYEPGSSRISVTLGKPPKRINRAIRNIKNTVR